jgi:hypothetical protein
MDVGEYMAYAVLNAEPPASVLNIPFHMVYEHKLLNILCAKLFQQGHIAHTLGMRSSLIRL